MERSPEYYKCKKCKSTTCLIHDKLIETCKCAKCPTCLTPLVNDKEMKKCLQCDYSRKRD
jgi:hypothetical protein